MRHSKIILLTILITLTACGSENGTSISGNNESTLNSVNVSQPPAVLEAPRPAGDATGASEPKVMDLDAAIQKKLFKDTHQNVLIIADYNKSENPEKFLKILDQLQKSLDASKVKVYRVDITSKSTVAKTIIAKHSKNPDESFRKLPVAVLTEEPTKMVSRMEGQSDLNVLKQFVVSNFKTKQPATTPSSEQTLADKAIMFSSPSCGACKIIKPTIEKLQREGLPIEIYSTDTHPDETSKYGIKMLPTFIFFDADGKVLSRHDGTTSEQDLKVRFKKS